MSTPLPGADALGALTVFVDDLPAEVTFYREVFGLPVAHRDQDSTVFMVGATVLNLLAAEHADELVAPARATAVGSTAQVLLTLWVPDTDAVCELLRQRGATLLNGPVDRRWGMRTAAFASPAGLVWEVAQNIGGTA